MSPREIRPGPGSIGVHESSRFFHRVLEEWHTRCHATNDSGTPGKPRAELDCSPSQPTMHRKKMSLAVLTEPSSLVGSQQVGTFRHPVEPGSITMLG